MKNKNSGDQLGQRLRQISADLKLYIEKRLELMLLNTGEYISGWMAASVLRLTGAILLLFGVCFLLVALALYLGELLDSDSLGYVIVSLPLLLIGILFIYLKPKGVFERVEQVFDAEVMKAFNGEVKQKQLESESAEPSGLKKEKND